MPTKYNIMDRIISKILSLESEIGAWTADDAARLVDITMLPYYIKNGYIERVQDGLTPKYHTTDKVYEFMKTQPVVEVEENMEIDEHMFDNIVGLDDVKKLLLMAIKASEPVHVGLLGGPATAKSIILYTLEKNLPSSLYIDCSISSKSGIGEQLEAHRPKYLLLDEFDKMKNTDDYNILLNVMASQKYVKTMGRGNRVEMPMKTWVIAAMNSLAIPKTIKDRFLTIIKLKEYNRGDAMKVMKAIMTYDKNIEEEVAMYIARRVVDELGSKNVRRAIQIANLVVDYEASEIYDRIDEIIELIKSNEI